MSRTLEIAKRVMLMEAEAIQCLGAAIPEDFSTFVDAVLSCKGRVIISGVGKSGHVGRKISATLASTGTPSYFIHATEASHGDLGVVSQHDVCLLISNSGETTELSDIIAHTRRFTIPMAAISSKPDSTLMQAADYRLTLPKAPEACPIGMAPTTSTTLTLALGDALAVTLMELRDFGQEHFKIFHPGGKLGAQMATVGQLMRPKSEMALVREHDDMKSVVIEMTRSGYGVAVVTDGEDHITGIITDGDLRRNIEQVFSMHASDIQSTNPITISKDMLAQVALNLMQENKIYALLVVEGQKPVGLLRMHDLLHAGIV